MGSNLAGLAVAPYCGQSNGTMLVGYHWDTLVKHFSYLLFSSISFDIMHGVSGDANPRTSVACLGEGKFQN